MSHNPDASLNIERAILSSVIFDPATLEDVNIKLSASDFFLPFHRKLFEVIVELDKKEMPIDEEFIKNRLSKNKNWDEVHFLDVLSANPISNSSAYVDELLSHSTKRKLERTALDVRKSIEEGKDADEILQENLDALEKIETSSFTLDLVGAEELEDVLPEFILASWIPIPKSALTLISADGGVGKTWFAIQAAIRYVVSTKYTKFACLWLSEDPQPVIKSRINDVINFMGMSKEAHLIMKNIKIITNEPPSLLVSKGYKQSEVSPLFRQIRKQLKAFDLIFIDPMIDFFGGDENDNSQLGTFFKPFKKWVAEENISIVFLHHHTKGSDGKSGTFRGGTAIRTSMRIAYELDFIKNNQGEKIKDNRHERAIKLTKDNWGGGNKINLYIGASVNKQLVPHSADFETVWEYEEEDNNSSIDIPTI